MSVQVDCLQGSATAHNKSAAHFSAASILRMRSIMLVLACLPTNPHAVLTPCIALLMHWLVCLSACSVGQCTRGPAHHSCKHPHPPLLCDGAPMAHESHVLCHHICCTSSTPTAVLAVKRINKIKHLKQTRPSVYNSSCDPAISVSTKTVASKPISNTLRMNEGRINQL